MNTITINNLDFRRQAYLAADTFADAVAMQLCDAACRLFQNDLRQSTIPVLDLAIVLADAFMHVGIEEELARMMADVMVRKLAGTSAGYSASMEGTSSE